MKVSIATLMLLLSGVAMAAGDVDIFESARRGDVAAIDRYAGQGGDVELRNDRGHTPFILATYYGHNAAAGALLKYGADACGLDDKGSNAYMGVAFRGHMHTAKWLLANTACALDHSNHAGQTALMMAALFGREDMVALFLDSGASARIIDKQGNTAESLARSQGLARILDMIAFHLR